MKDALKGYLGLASGLSEVTRQRAIGAAKALVAQGEATAGQVTSLADDLLAQSRSNREAVTALVKYEVDRALGRVGLASNDEVGELTARIRALEGSVRELHRDLAAAGHGDSAPAKATPAKATPTKTAAAKTTPAKATSAKATPAKATSAKATPANATPAKATPAKATSAKAAPAKASPARTAPATGRVRAAPGKAATAAKAPAAKRGGKTQTPSAAPTASAKRGA